MMMIRRDIDATPSAIIIITPYFRCHAYCRHYAMPSADDGWLSLPLLMLMLTLLHAIYILMPPMLSLLLLLYYIDIVFITPLMPRCCHDDADATPLRFSLRLTFSFERCHYFHYFDITPMLSLRR